MSPEPRRTVHVTDALAWLETHVVPACSVVASIPDLSEFPGRTVVEWCRWFEEAAQLILRATPPEGVTIFYQTDIKVEGEWIDKGFLCQSAARRLEVPLRWHKIACRVPAGRPTGGRPGYAHVLCFSRSVTPSGRVGWGDVAPALGDKVWERGMGFEICRSIAEFIRTETTTRTVLNPFSGLGSMLAVANASGLDAIGLERSPKRAARSRALSADLARRVFCASEASGDSEGVVG